MRQLPPVWPVSPLVLLVRAGRCGALCLGRGHFELKDEAIPGDQPTGAQFGSLAGGSRDEVHF